MSTEPGIGSAFLANYLLTLCLVITTAPRFSPENPRQPNPLLPLIAREIAVQGTAISAGDPQIPAVPISVSSVQMNPDQPTVTFTLHNSSSKAITAWHVSVTVGRSSGGKGTDAYRSFAGLTKGSSHIVPGGSITVTANIPGNAPMSSPLAVITPTCAVFEDKSFAGDSKFADFIFERRSGELAAWRQITGEFEKARAGERVELPALEHVLSTIGGSPQNSAGATVKQTVRANLSIAIAAVRAGRSSAESKLNSLLADAQRNLAAAATHSRE